MSPSQVFLRTVIASGALILFLGEPGKARSQPVPPKKEAPADEVQQLLETVGLLAGLQLYQTYLNMGLLADGKAVGLYDESAARQLLASVLTPLETVDKQLTRVAKLTRTKEDRDAVGKLLKTTGLLRQQGKDLETFWGSRKPTDAARYEATRKRAWEEITALLGLDKK